MREEEGRRGEGRGGEIEKKRDKKIIKRSTICYSYQILFQIIYINKIITLENRNN